MGLVSIADVPFNARVTAEIWLSGGTLMHQSIAADLSPESMTMLQMEWLAMEAALAGFKPLSKLVRRYHDVQSYGKMIHRIPMENRTSVTGDGS